jgi:hypothetical protein
MEGSRTRQKTTLSLQREFTGSRLEKQILIRAFDLVMPARGSDRVTEEQLATETTGRPPVEPHGSHGD